MTVRKEITGKWLVEVDPQGRDGPRKRKRFVTKGETLTGEIFQMEQNNHHLS